LMSMFSLVSLTPGVSCTAHPAASVEGLTDGFNAAARCGGQKGAP
jgi:hypothetical protein